MQSTFPTFHVGIIMDGNGRWATRRGLPRGAGHRAGVGSVRRIVEHAPTLGITTLTLFAFSSDNWRRPAAEVDALLRLMRAYLRIDRQRFVDQGARLSVIGRRDRLSAALRGEIERTERASFPGCRLHVRIAIDYSAREAIARAAASWSPGGPPSAESFTRVLCREHDTAAVDLLIRTGGEQRLSDFLLWECAYAELWFSDTMWPDFTPAALGAAVAAFRQRERRFGGLGVVEPAA
jgi:undecaprenyl diphosphate synthase